MNRTRILLFVAIFLLFISSVSAFEVWNMGYNELLNNNVVVIMNDFNKEIYDIELKLNDGQYEPLLANLPAGGRYTYELSKEGEYVFYLKAKGVEEQSFNIIISTEKKMEANVAQKIYLEDEQLKTDEERRKLKAMKREDLLKREELKQSSQGEIITPKREFNYNALFLKVVIILFIVIALVALYEYFTINKTGGTRK